MSGKIQYVVICFMYYYDLRGMKVFFMLSGKFIKILLPMIKEMGYGKILIQPQYFQAKKKSVIIDGSIFIKWLVIKW